MSQCMNLYYTILTICSFISSKSIIRIRYCERMNKLIETLPMLSLTLSN